MATQLELAEQIARKAHQGQQRWDGSPYIVHPERVAKAVLQYSEDHAVVAWLHDVLEDTPLTSTDLMDAGIDRRLADAVLMLTHFEDESYLDYILDIKDNPIARIVKIADIRDNMADGQTNQKKHKMGKNMREKYELALYILNQGVPDASSRLGKEKTD